MEVSIDDGCIRSNIMSTNNQIIWSSAGLRPYPGDFVISAYLHECVHIAQGTRMGRENFRDYWLFDLTPMEKDSNYPEHFSTSIELEAFGIQAAIQDSLKHSPSS